MLNLKPINVAEQTGEWKPVGKRTDTKRDEVFDDSLMSPHDINNNGLMPPMDKTRQQLQLTGETSPSSIIQAIAKNFGLKQKTIETANSTMEGYQVSGTDVFLTIEADCNLTYRRIKNDKMTIIASEVAPDTAVSVINRFLKISTT